MARQETDLKVTYEMMGIAGATGVGCGAGVGQMASGILHLDARRFFGGALMLVLALLLGLGFAIDQELRLEEEAAEFMAQLD